MEQMDDLKKKVESLLFSSGRKMHVSEIARLVGNIDVEATKKALIELKEKYKEDSSLMVMQEGDEWKLTVKEKYIPIVHKIVTKTELTKTIMETLAVIAYKAPVLQSDIIKIRTNKAYDHLKELDEAGYLSRTKHGRTKMIKLTPKFFEYFDIPPEHLKEKFKSVQQLERAVEEKEQELMEKKDMINQKKEERSEKDKAHKKKTAEEAEKLDQEIEEIEQAHESHEVDILDKEGKKHKLKEYVSERIENTELEKPELTMPLYREKVGDLDVYETGLTPKEKVELVEDAEKERAIEEKEEAAKKAKDESEEEAGEAGIAEEGDEEGEREEAPVEGEAEEGEEGPAEVEPGEEYSLTKEKAPEKEESTEDAAEEVEKAVKPGLKEKEGETAEEVHPETIEEHARRIAEAEMKGKPIDFKGERLFAKGVPKEIQEQIDKRVKEIIYGKKKEEGKDKKEKETEEEKEGEGKGGLPY
jgi:segregation and condensation protein B